jgi:hypothetical protein
MPRFTASLLTPLLALLLGFTAQGCGDKRGPIDPTASEPTMIVTNTETHSMTVYVDDAKLGTLESEEQREFFILPGRHRVEVRYGNDLNSREDRGYHDFDSYGLVRIS